MTAPVVGPGQGAVVAPDEADQARLRRGLLAPHSIALVGASDDPLKASSRPLRFLRQGGYTGTVYPVNARREMVGGERAYSSLRDLPEVPDHVYIMVPAAAVLDVVAECAELRVPVASILSGGFAEAGAEGAERQAAVLSVAAAGGVRLLGPSSLGVVDLANDMRLTGNAVFADPSLPAGGTFVVSQSGSMIGSICSRAQEHGAGFASLVSVGGEMDLSIGEICSLTLDDPAVTGYLLFLESIRGADRLAAFASAAAQRNKPVVAYKVGRSPFAAELALSHTGALAGEDDVATQFFAQCGIARVETLAGLLEAQPLMSRLPIRASGAAGGRVGVVTTTGGGAAMVVDQLGVRGIEVVTPSRDTYDKLGAAGVNVAPSRIVDLTLAGTRPDVMTAALEVLLDAPEFDLVLAVSGSSARLQPELVVAPVVAVAGSDRPLVSFLVPEAPQARQLLRAAGVPVFQAPETCADVISAALDRRTPRDPALTIVDDGSETSYEVLDEQRSYDVLESVGVPVAQRVVLDVVNGAVSTAEVGAVAYPVAVKALDPALPHKSDAGAVVLGVEDTTELLAAVGRIDTNIVSVTGKPLRSVLVQQMTPGVGELLVGFRIDPDVGPVVVVAGGGVLTELYRDRVVRLAPVTVEEALSMLSAVKAVTAMDGYRGGPPADLHAVAETVAAMSRLAAHAGVVEAEVNPLIVHEAGGGVTAVDALVRVKAETR